MRYREPPTIPITLARAGAGPLHRQIAEHVAVAVEQGVLPTGCRLPSTRTLAQHLGVSRGVAAEAYAHLAARGYLWGRRGSGTYVATSRPATAKAGPDAARPDVATPNRPATERHLSTRPHRMESLMDLTPGGPCDEAFPLAAWRTAWRHATFRPPPGGPSPALGLPELRHAIAAHVQRTHGIVPAGHQVVVTAGAAHGLRTVLAALNLRGPQVAIEDPAPTALHLAALGHGAAEPVPVDDEGVPPHAIPAGCRALVVTPDCNVPLGQLMSARRRAAALAWAADTDGYLVTVACDAVFRPQARLLPRLSGPTTVHLGGFCDVLTPNLKLGYAIVPADLAADVGRQVLERGEQPPFVTQAAVAHLLRDGTVARQMHRLGRTYEHRRRITAAALAPLGPGLRVGGLSAVDTAVLHLPPWLSADAVAAALLDRNLRVPTLGSYSAVRPAPPALVIGYGRLPDRPLRRALAVLVDALGDIARLAGSRGPLAPAR